MKSLESIKKAATECRDLLSTVKTVEDLRKAIETRLNKTGTINSIDFGDGFIEFDEIESHGLELYKDKQISGIHLNCYVDIIEDNAITRDEVASIDDVYLYHNEDGSTNFWFDVWEEYGNEHDDAPVIFETTIEDLDKKYAEYLNGGNDIEEFGPVIDFTGFELDITSEYIVDGHIVNVMLLPDDLLYHSFKTFLGGDIEYVDFYAHIDTRVNLVKKLEVIITAGNDKRVYTMDIPQEAQVKLYLKFIDTDKENLEEVLVMARENYYEKKEGVTDEQIDREKPELMKEWFAAYHSYASDPAHSYEELDFVMEGVNRGITESVIYGITSENIATWYDKFAKEHGLL